MSYARWGEQGSDVYVYESIGRQRVECCACDLQGGVCFETVSRSQMVEHLREHVAHGHVVPLRTFDDLAFDIENAGDIVQATPPRGEIA